MDVFGLTVWGMAILAVFAAGLEAYDHRLAMLFVLVTLFALFLRHSDEFVKILRSLNPFPASQVPPGETT